MAQNIKSIAAGLGAEVVGTLPEVSGGAFGAARLAQIMSEKLAPSRGKRPGRPSNAEWVKRPKVPMSDETFDTLNAVAKLLSSDQGRKVSPMQLAAEILEVGVRSLQSKPKKSGSRKAQATGR